MTNENDPLEQYAETAEQLAQGNVSAASAALAGAVAGHYGGPLAGAFATGLLTGITKLATETATKRFLDAGVTFDTELQKKRALGRCLAETIEPWVTDLNRALERLEADQLKTFVRLVEQGDAELRTLLRFIDDTVANRDGQDELLRMMHEFLERVAPSKIAPPLHFRTRVWRPGLDPFYPDYERVAFVGRDRELRKLEAFVRAAPARQPDFRWWLWVGPGGQGKSRLAREFCTRMQREGWDCGFLLQPADFERWSDWIVSRPTLLVIDHVAPRAEQVQRALRALIVSKNLHAPLRILMLERPFKDEDAWARQFMPGAYGDVAADLLECAHVEAEQTITPSLSVLAERLGPLDDDALWNIVTATLIGRTDEPLDRDRTLEQLHELDSQRRPLFAILASEALTQGGANARRWDREAISEFILKREVERWKETLGIGQLSVAAAERAMFEEHLNLTAYATVAGPQALERSAALDGLTARLRRFGIAVPERVLPDWLRVFAGYGAEPEQDIIPPIGPDILGELFVLERLDGKHGIDSNRRVPREQMAKLVNVALAFSRHATLAFLSRCITDFPKHPALALFPLINPPEEGAENYGYYLDYATAMSELAEQLSNAGRVDLSDRTWTHLIEASESLLRSMGNDVLAQSLSWRLALCHYNRAVLREISAPVDALEDVREALRRFSASPQGEHGEAFFAARVEARARLLYSKLLEHGGDVSSAEFELDKLFRDARFPDDERAVARLRGAELRETQSDIEGASAAFVETLQLADSSGHVGDDVRVQAMEGALRTLWNQARALDQNGDIASSLRLYDRFIKVADKAPRALAMGLVNRADVKRRSNAHPGAVEDYAEVLAISEAPPEQHRKARLGRARIHLDLGRPDAARTDVEAVLGAVDSTPDEWASAQTLSACIHHFQGRLANAIKELATVAAREDVMPALRDQAARMITAWQTH